MSLNNEKLILNLLGHHPKGLSLNEIKESLKDQISRRTLQRNLALLVEKKEIKAQGKTRNLKYFLIKEEEKTSCLFSKKAENLLKIVNQPIASRKHIGYQRDFLESYIPNRTFYLNAKVRKHLSEIAKNNDKYAIAGTYAREVFNRLLIDLSWNSSRLEGNTYSLLETERLLRFQQLPKEKDLKETQMILNHKDAIEFLVNCAEHIGINRFTLLNLHALLSNNLLFDSTACGKIRSIPVGIAQSTYIPIAIFHLLDDLFNLLIQKASKIQDPFEQSFFLLIHIAYLQPFEDVNKRVSRLACNIPFILKNLPPISFVDVSTEVYISGLLAVYELNKTEAMEELFIWSYERSSSIYAALHESMGMPNSLYLKYREKLSVLVSYIVENQLDLKKAQQMIKSQAQTICRSDRKKFESLVLAELNALHEGSIARYKLKLQAFQAWREQWHFEI